MSAPIVDALEILERIKDGFFALDHHWNFTYINEKATRLLFRSRNDLVGKNVWREFPEAVDLPFYEKYHQALQSQEPVFFETHYPPLDTWFRVWTYPSPNGLSIFFQDATDKDRKEWEKSHEMLQYTEKLSITGQLAAGIAHEIRNPITAIKGFLQLMRSGTEDKKSYLNIMTSEIERIEQILSELLMLAKPQESKFERKDITLLLDQVVTLLSTQAILNNVEIVTAEPRAHLPFVDCDENQLKQAFINYIKNAIDAMPTGGTLVIRVEQLGTEKIKISFTDRGMGMPEEVLSQLGQPFYTTKEKGTGLGFMISKKIIENHAGEVNVTSEINSGTTVEVRLPMVQERVGLREATN
ncbi:ATP-binding protein [Ammoniphilus resinae]|uniref:histidine kinase n=1 Tax=Ammoniphilus resinae TaxID=861532 RepID=A0ABS4GY98_9BACL|nr:ATP-binding protein [Ammoniphilus resinae]MBP1935082.1 signal transduction histidine kinase [Ammoniphilus resinae]